MNEETILELLFTFACFGAVVVTAQLVERSLLRPEICSSYPVIGQFCLLSTRFIEAIWKDKNEAKECPKILLLFVLVLLPSPLSTQIYVRWGPFKVVKLKNFDCQFSKIGHFCLSPIRDSSQSISAEGVCYSVTRWQNYFSKIGHLHQWKFAHKHEKIV